MLTLARGWQWPNDWAEAQWLFTYEFGFMKRALPGALLGLLLGFAETESQALTILRIVTSSVFLLFGAALFYVSMRVRKRAPDVTTGVLLALVFLSSPFVVMSAHTNGYFDNITITLSVVAGVLVLRDRPWLAGVVLGVGVLIHETILIVGLPPILFMALVRSAPSARLGLRAMLPLALPPLLALALVVVNQALFVGGAELEHKLMERIGEFGFVERRRHILVPRAYTTSLIAFFEQQRVHFVGRVFDPGNALRALPAVAALSVAAWSSVRARFSGARALLIQLAFLGVALGPLALHAVAWDTSRIWTYPILTAFLALWGLSEVEPRERTSSGHLLTAGLMLVVVHHVLVHTRLMEQKRDLFPLEWRLVVFAVPLGLIAWCLARRPPGMGADRDAG